MKLSKLAIVNYRRIPDFDISVRDHLVLLGPTNTGKSSIIRGLNLLLGSSGGRLASSFSERDFTDPSAPLVLEATLGNLTDEEKAAFPDEVTVGPPDTLTIRLEAQVDVTEERNVLVTRTFPDSGHQRGLSAEQIEAIGWRHVPATRSLQRELAGDRPGTVRSLISALDLGTDRDAFVKFGERYRELLGSAESIKSFRRSLAQALSSALPGEVTEDNVRLLSSAEQLDDPLAGTNLALVEAGKAYPLTEQSDGVRALSALALFGMGHLGANIVAVDEPETHLHPTAQRGIGLLMATRDSQSIIATQSSYFASRFHPLHVIALGPDRSPRQLPAGASIAEEKNLLRWWESAIIEPLTASKVVVVEGPSDKILLDGVARLINLALDRLGVTIFALNGADTFDFFYSLIGRGFGVPFFGLLDEDHRPAWSNVLGVSPSDIESAGYRVCDPGLEGECVANLGVDRVVELMCLSSSFSERQILAATNARSRASVGAGMLVAYCERNKTAFAAALAAHMTSDDARRLTKLNELLQLAT